MLAVVACSGGKTTTGSASGSSGSGGAGSSSTGGTGGSTSSSGSSSSSGSTGPDGGACATPLSARIRITDADVGSTVVYNEVDSNGPALGLAPLAISPIPSGGSRVAWMGNDGMVHVAALDTSDHLVAGSTFALPAFDFQDRPREIPGKGAHRAPPGVNHSVTPVSA